MLRAYDRDGGQTSKAAVLGVEFRQSSGSGRADLSPAIAFMQIGKKVSLPQNALILSVGKSL